MCINAEEYDGFLDECYKRVEMTSGFSAENRVVS